MHGHHRPEQLLRREGRLDEHGDDRGELPALHARTQLPADNTAAPSRATLPRSVFGPGSLIAVDVVFTFRPSFGARFIPAMRIARSMYVQPRYASLVDLDTTGNDGIATKCP